MSASTASMAWRNIWRNRRRTILTLFGMAFGILLAVVFTGVGDSSWAEMIDLAARSGSGHVTIQHPEYSDRPSLKLRVSRAGRIAEEALEDPRVTRVVERVSGQVLLATAAQSQGAFFMAVDPAKEDSETLLIHDSVTEGEMLPSAEGGGMVIGAKIAAALDAGLGRKVVYTMTDSSGEIVSGLARVSGIVETGVDGIDGGLCLLPIGTVRELLGYGEDEATQIAVFLDDQRSSDDVAARLSAKLGKDAAALTWREVQPELAGFIGMKVAGTLFMEALILVLIAAGIFNTLFVSVMERMREFGILSAIGFSPSRLFALVMWESLWLGAAGIVAGAIASVVPYYFLNTRGIPVSAMTGNSGSVEMAGVGMPEMMYVDLYAQSAVAIVVAVLAATLLSGLYPAWKAGRVVPVESIKLV